MPTAFQWITFANPVAIWWCFLTSISIVNILFWGWTWNYFRSSTSRIQCLLIYSSALYVFGCAFRSFLPRADVQRIVLFDTWFSSVLVGRSVATIAELAFVFQWALVLNLVAKSTNSKMVEKISLAIVPTIFLAECFSWFAVITTNYLGNTIEESLWTVTYTLIGISLVLLVPRLKGALKWAAVIAVVGTFAYVVFMSTVDVPMYFHRWQADLASGKEFLGLITGLSDLNARWVLTHDIAAWRDEIPWMSLYFSFAVWTSLALCYVPKAKAS